MLCSTTFSIDMTLSTDLSIKVYPQKRAKFSKHFSSEEEQRYSISFWVLNLLLSITAELFKSIFKKKCSNK